MSLYLGLCLVSTGPLTGTDIKTVVIWKQLVLEGSTRNPLRTTIS